MVWRTYSFDKWRIIGLSEVIEVVLFTISCFRKSISPLLTRMKMIFMQKQQHILTEKHGQKHGISGMRLEILGNNNQPRDDWFRWEDGKIVEENHFGDSAAFNAELMAYQATLEE